MTAKRVLNKVGPSGADHVADVADSIEALWKNILGIASSVSGTNTVTFEVPLETGLTNLVAGQTLLIEPANTNTGPVTLELANLSIGAKALQDADGNALAGGEFVAGRAYLVAFWDDDAFRIVGSGGSSGSAALPLTRMEVFTSSGTWTAPHACNALFLAIGAGGSGGNYNSWEATGGGAGGFCQKYVSGIDAADEATITVGAGGARQATLNADGNNGGTTTVTSADFTINLSAGGGSGGSGQASAGVIAGGVGGSASGGDINYTGGNGGQAGSGTNSTSGGGAVNFFDSPRSAPSAVSTTGSGATAVDVTLSYFGLWLSATASPGQSAVTVSSAADPFNGGGGGLSTTSAAHYAVDGGVGGGGGGVNGNAGPDYSGKGGDGLVVVLYTEEIA